MNVQASQASSCTQASGSSENASQYVIRRERKISALDNTRKLAIESDAHLILDSIVVKSAWVFEVHL